MSIIVLAASSVALPAQAKTDKEPYACASPTIEQAGPGAVAIDVAWVTAIAVGTVAISYECYDFYSSGSTYVGTGTGGWWDCIKETGRNYGHYACFWR